MKSVKANMKGRVFLRFFAAARWAPAEAHLLPVYRGDFTPGKAAPLTPHF